MEFVCDTPEATSWFRIESEAEAIQESQAMNHAVDKFFVREMEKARASYRPTSRNFVEQDIGLKRYLKETMPMFLSLRNAEGERLATAMLPPRGQNDPGFDCIIVGPGNANPFVSVGFSIHILAEHYGLELNMARCYPYHRTHLI